jgi:hypothetical protein
MRPDGVQVRGYGMSADYLVSVSRVNYSEASIGSKVLSFRLLQSVGYIEPNQSSAL